MAWRGLRNRTSAGHTLSAIGLRGRRRLFGYALLCKCDLYSLHGPSGPIFKDDHRREGVRGLATGPPRTDRTRRPSEEGGVERIF